MTLNELDTSKGQYGFGHIMYLRVEPDVRYTQQQNCLILKGQVQVTSLQGDKFAEHPIAPAKMWIDCQLNTYVVDTQTAGYTGLFPKDCDMGSKEVQDWVRQAMQSPSGVLNSKAYDICEICGVEMTDDWDSKLAAVKQFPEKTKFGLKWKKAYNDKPGYWYCNGIYKPYVQKVKEMTPETKAAKDNICKQLMKTMKSLPKLSNIPITVKQSVQEDVDDIPF